MEKLFRTTAKVEGKNEPMVDWYEAETEAKARALFDEDCHRYGLPSDKTTVEIVECDPETLKPVATYETEMQKLCCTENRKALAAISGVICGDIQNVIHAGKKMVGFKCDGDMRLFDSNGSLYLIKPE